MMTHQWFYALPLLLTMRGEQPLVSQLRRAYRIQADYFAKIDCKMMKVISILLNPRAGAPVRVTRPGAW